MNRLPNELLDRICSFLGRDSLWAMLQLSSRFRSIAMLPYLSRFGVSQANIQSGTLALSDSFFILFVVARIIPIKRLICFELVVPGAPLIRYQKLASILSRTAPIPDIVIYNRHYMLQRTRRETAYLLSCIPSSATSTLLIVKGSAMYLSRPRSAPPIRWKLLPPPLGSSNLPTAMKILIVMFGIPLLFAYLVSGVINFGILLIWTYRRLFRPLWPQDERIIEDAGLLVFDDWMRIQSLPGKLTLVTLTERKWPVLVIKPIPGLADNVYSSLLASLDLGHHLQRLTVETNTNLFHSELMAFLRRHPDLTSIHLEPDSIRASSLITIPMSPNAENKVVVLTAPSLTSRTSSPPLPTSIASPSSSPLLPRPRAPPPPPRRLRSPRVPHRPRGPRHPPGHAPPRAQSHLPRDRTVPPLARPPRRRGVRQLALPRDAPYTRARALAVRRRAPLQRGGHPRARALARALPKPAAPDVRVRRGREDPATRACGAGTGDLQRVQRDQHADGHCIQYQGQL
ncbi:hypothetical protein B0H13DRAFT_2060220, partial [Mycena leptocephala]